MEKTDALKDGRYVQPNALQQIHNEAFIKIIAFFEQNSGIGTLEMENRYLEETRKRLNLEYESFKKANSKNRVS